MRNDKAGDGMLLLTNIYKNKNNNKHKEEAHFKYFTLDLYIAY